MLPSIDLRIATLVKAIQQVILPALPASERLAQEQARLIVGHLGMIADQWKHALPFELRSLENMRALAEELAPLVAPAQSTALTTALAATADTDPTSIEPVQAAICTIGKAVDAVILGDDGRIPLPDAARKAILRYGKAQSFRERAWFGGSGQDPDRAELPAIRDIR